MSVAGRCPPGQLTTSIAIAIVGLSSIPASGQNILPGVVIVQPLQKPKRASENRPASVSQRTPARRLNSAANVSSAAATSAAASHFVARTQTLNAARENILPKIGTNTYTFDPDAIESVPQGGNPSVGNVLLRAPGVSQETSLSFEGPVHIRLEHGFIQYRINGILLPDGATGFGQVLETGLISSLTF